RVLLLFRYMWEYCWKGLFEISLQKAFPDIPFNTRVDLCRVELLFRYMWEYCSNACFEISLQKAFPDIPFNTRVYL
ncbi:hypothetical protein P7K49_026340, partial [Saguinus oedipus]